MAFYGRTGNALMKSLKRLSIDPLAVYGTLCVKCPVPDPAMADPACVARLVEELAIVSPKIVVVMGADALGVVNELDVPLRRELAPTPGELQRLTPSIEALYVPEHRRRARRGERQARVLGGVPGARPVVGGPAARTEPACAGRGRLAAMDLEEKSARQVGDRCEECGAKLTAGGDRGRMESGGPALCTVHADEVVPVGAEDDGFGSIGRSRYGPRLSRPSSARSCRACRRRRSGRRPRPPRSSG